jgi:hypothetical protein
MIVATGQIPRLPCGDANGCRATPVPVATAGARRGGRANRDGRADRDSRADGAEGADRADRAGRSSRWLLTGGGDQVWLAARLQ